MIKPDQIPDEVMAVFKDAWFNQGTLTTRESLAAAINAWLGMIIGEEIIKPRGSFKIHINIVREVNLPIQETRDE